MEILYAQSIVMSLVYLGVLAVTIFSFINALLYSAESYVAAGKLTKTTWCAILGVGVVLQWMSFSGNGIRLPLVGFILLIAAIVYLVDVRPALSGLYRR